MPFLGQLHWLTKINLHYVVDVDIKGFFERQSRETS